MTMPELRVVQWTTGKVGKLALRGILDDPRLKLVGVFAHSPDKAGRDAGELCGRPPCGVRATDDIEALLVLDADTVIYTPFMADVDHAVRLLENGIDVISTNLFLNVGGIQGEVRRRIEAACERGGSSFYITGVNPGWINSMVVALTAVCRRIDMVSVSESADCAVYESRETWLAMGISLPEATAEVVETAKSWLQSFYDATQRMAVALGYATDDMEFFIEFATASRTVELGFMTIPEGTIAALRAGWNGKVAGRTVVQTKVAWYLTKDLNEGWTFNDDQYHVVIKGEPTIGTRIRFTPPEHWGNHEWDTMTAMPAVNAALDVAGARSGILTLRDIALTAAPAGLWAARS